MNYLESIYCSQYYEHSKSGHSLDKARRNAGIFTSLMIFMLLVAACLLADMFTPHHPISRFFSGGVGYHALGRMAGKLLGATVVLGIVGIINLTYGSKANYERMMALAATA